MASPDERPAHPLYVGYSLALVACGVAGLVQFALQPILGDRFPLAVFSAAVAAAAWTGGSGPGLLATLITAVAGGFFFLEPRYSLFARQPEDLLALSLFILTGILISLSMRRLRRQALSDRDARTEAERLLQHTAHLQDLTSALSRANTPDEVTRACLVEMLHAVDAAAGGFALVNDEGFAYSYGAMVGVGPQVNVSGVTVPLSLHTPVADALRRHELAIVESLWAGDQRFADNGRDPLTAGYESAVVVPLVRANRAIAAIVLLFDRPRMFAGDEHQFLLMAGSRTTQALERARLYEMTERARADAEDFRSKADLELRERQRVEQQLRVSEAQYRGLAARTNRLYELSAGLSEASTVDAVAKVIVQQGKAVVGASAASVAVLGDGGREFETLYAEGYPRSIVERTRRYPADPALLSTAAAKSREPVLVSTFSDLQRLYPVSSAISADGGYASAAALPLTVDTAVMGVLAFHFTAPVNFDLGYSALLVSVTQHCSQALDRARLYESAQAARSAAEEANRSKDEFLSTVSHELRTPLNAMLGWASMLRNGSLDEPRTRRAVEAIFNNATRQAHLIEELLDVSRIVAGRAPLDPDRLDLGDHVRGAVEAILPLAEAKGVEVRVTTPSGVTVFADPRRLEQVFLNVLSNAVKFTPGGGHIAVDMTVDGDRVEVVVRDTGAGIEASFLPHVFERFRQADSTMARSVGGLGLGLFIAKHLVEAQNGRLTAHSDGPGRGSTFTVSLPVMAARQTLPDVRKAPAATETQPTDPQLLRGIRVLLVDDEPDAREVMGSALEACGAIVNAVSSAADAVRMLDEHPFDVLLSDIAMPGTDGYALIQGIRQRTNTRYAAIPAAAVTASASDLERLRALTSGFQLHLAKPVQPHALAEAVARLHQSPVVSR